jgi:hypothetical protein
MMAITGFDVAALLIVLTGIIQQTELSEGGWYENLESIILAAIGIFSLLLLALSILAYRRTGLKKIIYAAIAFSLFAIQLILGSLEEAIGFLEEPPIGDILISSMTLAILILFFMAIVRKN